jgi:hypothetical protein
MKAYDPFHPAHPGTYAFRVARRFALLFILTAFTACSSSRKSVEIQSTNQAQEHEVRLSYGQSLFALFDSLAAVQILEADSLEMEFFDAAEMGIRKDSLAATRPPQSQAPGRLAARLRVKGIRANTQTTHTQVATSESLAVDADSVHRISQEELDESIHEEKVVKPPNTLRNLSVLLGLAFICFIIWRVKR